MDRFTGKSVSSGVPLRMKESKKMTCRKFSSLSPATILFITNNFISWISYYIRLCSVAAEQIIYWGGGTLHEVVEHDSLISLRGKGGLYWVMMESII